MKNRELARQIQTLRHLISRTTELSGEIELQAHWAKYLCVLVAGFLENALSELYRDYCARNASSRVSRFAARTLKRVQNPKTGTFVEVTSAFDVTWAAALERFIEEDGRKEAIDSIMTNRHLIAHGKSSDITIARVDAFFRKSVDVVTFLERSIEQ